MKFILEYKSFYKEDDIVLIEYWYSGIITPVRIVEKISKQSFRVTHKIDESEIFNAPDEVIRTSDIIDIYKKSK